MRFICFIVSFFVIIIQANGQSNNYAPVGATWYYDANQDEDCVIGDCDYTVVKSVKDTLIDGINSRKLESKMFLDNILVIQDEFYVYENAGQVFIYDPCNEQFDIIYDFNLNEGDSLNIQDSLFCGYWPLKSNIAEFGCFASIIDSTDVVEISGMPLKRFFINQEPLIDSTCIDAWFFDNNEIIERIGNTGRFPFGEPINIIPEIGCCNENLMCYSDNEIIYNTIGLDCNLIESTGLTDLNSLEVATPVIENNKIQLFVPGDLLYSNIIIYDIMGVQLHNTIVTSDEIIIDLSLFPVGFYFLTINKNDFFETFKIIIP